MASVAEILFDNFKNKHDINAAINSFPLAATTVTRRVESLSEDVNRQVLKDMALCEYFSLQFDESLDISDVVQLIVFVRMFFHDSTTKEDFLTLLHLHGRTRGEDMYSELKKYVSQNAIPIHKLVAITTDGSPAMRGVRAGFIALCRKDPDFPTLLITIA